MFLSLVHRRRDHEAPGACSVTLMAHGRFGIADSPDHFSTGKRHGVSRFTDRMEYRAYIALDGLLMLDVQ